MKNIFITGISSGIGLSLAEYYAGQGVKVHGISRKPCPFTHSNLKHCQLDLQAYSSNTEALENFIKDVPVFDLVVLNAGVLGSIQEVKDANIEDMKSVMDMNLWAQKALIDFFLKRAGMNQVISISSGVVEEINKGWSSYVISKLALKALIELYAKENPDVHFLSLAPGLVDTAMLKSLLLLPKENFPSLNYLVEERKENRVFSLEEIAKIFDQKLGLLSKLKSGEYIDLRSF